MYYYFDLFGSMEIHVIRHTPVSVAKNTCYGRLAVPLADSFVADVEAYQEKLHSHYDALYSSPARRCTALAEALNLGKISTDDCLLELDFGDWEGKKWNAIDQQRLQRWMDDFVNQAPENGESLTHMFSRISTFMALLRKTKHEKVLIVTHAGVIRCLWAYLLDIPLNNIGKIPVGFHELFIANLGHDKEHDYILQLK